MRLRHAGKEIGEGRSRSTNAVATTLLVLGLALSGIGVSHASAQKPATEPAMKQDVTWYRYEIVNRFPHDPSAFTQGLVWHDGHLYEGTGLEGSSSVRKVKLETGEVLQKVDLPPDSFGEGIAIWKDSIIQLTWREGIAFLRELTTLRERKRFTYDGEGWGITTDGSRLVTSDGSSTLTFRDPKTFRETSHIDIVFRGRYLRSLNELEFIDGRIWANVWMTNQIVMIDPGTGLVTGVLDLTGILSAADRGGAVVDVLNGIAWDSAKGRIFVTGKNWPKLYEIRIVPM